MKKTLFILLCFLYAAMAIKAQTPCESVTADAFPINPQSGAHNYFGVRVSLSQAYSEDVTVTGYINTNYPFTLTITAGSLTAETAANFYETDPTGDAVVTVASVSPCQYSVITKDYIDEFLTSPYFDTLIGVTTQYSMNIKALLLQAGGSTLSNNYRQFIQTSRTDVELANFFPSKLFRYQLNA